MPLKESVAYSKIVQTPSGKYTIGLFNKQHKLIEYRVCDCKTKNSKCKCPRDKVERAKLKKKLHI